ncbi:hypothetical protein AC249_AIPGENE11034 [Exaiptasia diaphana]|nr:hypothetical protein AC249_AIPGENE11034 [Exaiptasia diaphana]
MLYLWGGGRGRGFEKEMYVNKRFFGKGWIPWVYECVDVWIKHSAQFNKQRRPHFYFDRENLDARSNRNDHKNSIREPCYQEESNSERRHPLNS